MVEAEGVSVTFTADDKDFNARLDNLEKRLGRAQEKAKKGGKSAGSAFFGGFAGGAAGVVAGGAMQTGPVNAVTDLLMNVLGAALLPLMQGLLPLLKQLGDASVQFGDWASKHPQATKTAAETAAGAYLGGKVAGPEGAVIGGAIGVQYSMKLSAEDAAKQKAYYDYIGKLQENSGQNWWQRNFPSWLGGHSDDPNSVSGLTAYDKAVAAHNVHINDQTPIPKQDPGLPYDPRFPPPNVSDLYGPSVVNTG